jgi:hypothetical protein
LLDGKLVFGTDYTIEYYQIAEENVGIDVSRTFPENSWTGEKMTDHRYRYFLNTDRSGDIPKYIKHYSKFVFLNKVPAYGQVFKVTYNKNIDLYNAVDRIVNLYNPTDLMPGKELPLLMEGAEYPGISIQGLMFDQTPNWDNTGTRYDAAPWGDTVSSYAVAKLRGDLRKDSLWIDVDSPDGIYAGQTISPLNTSTQIFRSTTVVSEVSGTRIFISNLDTVDTQIKNIYSTDTTATTTATLSTIIINTRESFNTSIKPGDYILIDGVNSNGGYGIDYINTTTVPILSTSTTSLVTAVVSPPDLPNGRQAQVQLTQVGLTVTNISVLLGPDSRPGWPGIGYSVPPTLTFSGTASPVTSSSYQVFLDPGFNLNAEVKKCTDNYIEIRSGRWELGSTSTTLNPGASFRLLSLVNDLEASNKLLYRATESMSSATILSMQTFAPFTDVTRAEVQLNGTEVPLTSTTTIWYRISNSIDGLDRAVVSIYSTSTATISGTMSVSLFGATELEFYSTNNDYNNLDSVINGSTISDTSLGYKPEDIIIDGNNFLNAVDSYAPEECVPGYVTDSIGINVFTVAESSSYPMVVSGAFAAGTDGITRATLSWLPDAPLGFRVQANGKVFDRVNNETSFFNQSSTTTAFPILINSTYSNALTTARLDFLIPTSTYDEFGSPVLIGDNISNPTYLTPARTVTGITRNFITISSTTYTRILMDKPASATSPVALNDDTTRVTFTRPTQYCIFDNTIVVQKQPVYTTVGYSFVTAGANVTVDSEYIGVELPSTVGNTGTVAVTSLLGFDDVRSVYVLLNGEEVPPSGNPDNLAVYGYVLSPAASNNNRAMVIVNGLSSNIYNLEAWFFNHPFPKFNTFHEQYYTIGSTATSNLILDRAPATIEPVSEQVIVEKITSTVRDRLLPPWASYYKVQNGQREYFINSKKPEDNGQYTLDNVKVYLNGIELRPGYDFLVATSSTNLINPNIVNGDAIAIESLLGGTYDYFVSGRNLRLTQPVTTATIKVTSFTDHDNMMIRTERFNGNDPVILTYPVLNENYVWVTVNDTQLTAGFDYSVMEDFRSIEFSGSVNIFPADNIVVMVFNPPSYGSSVLGHRIFKDMFGRHHYKRISEYFSTRLAQPLQYTDNTIVVVNGDHLLQPIPDRNVPGVIYVDGERIEYTAKDGNVLSGLRRSTLGTGPAKFSDIGTEVIDQSIRQTIPTVDYSLIQNIPSSNTTTYAINTITVVDTISFSINTTTHVGAGIGLLPLINLVDQVEVYYGGRQLRKTSMRVHDKSVSYYDSADSTIVYPPEFSVITTCSLTATVIGSTSTTIQTDVLYGTRVLSPAKINKDFNIGDIKIVSTLTTASSYLQFIEPTPGISNWIRPGDTLTINSKSVIVLGLLGDFIGNPTPGKLGFLLSSNIVASSENVTSLDFLRAPRFTANMLLTIGTTGTWTTSTSVDILTTATTGTIGTSTVIYSISPNVNDRYKAVCTITNLNTSVTSIINLTLSDYQQITLNIAESITTGTRITIVKKEGEFWTDTSSTSLLFSTGTQANFLRSRPAELPDIYFYGGEKVLIENSIALTDENGEPLEGY